MQTLKEEEYYLPNIAWIYWEGEYGRSIKWTLTNKEKVMSNVIPIFITKKTLSSYISLDNLPSNFNKLCTANRADYYRFKILSKYGGIWLDASIYLKNESILIDMMNEVKEKKLHFGGYNSFQKPPYHIEIGYMICPRDSPFMIRIMHEFDYMLNMGILNYMKMRVKEGLIITDNKVYKPPNYYNEYLSPSVCVQTVVQRDYYANPKKFVLRESVKDYYYLIKICGQNKKCHHDNWLNNKKINNLPIIKFTHVYRNSIPFPKTDFLSSKDFL